MVCAGAMLAAPGCFGGGTRTVCDPPDQVTAEPASPPTAAEVSIGEQVPGVDAIITVTVTSSPYGAEVYVDGVLAGVTPLQMQRASADAEMAIRVSRDGYRDEQRVLVGDRTQALTLTLGEAVASRPRCYQVRHGRGFVLS